VGLLLRERLAADGITLAAKTSGSKGLQLYGSLAGRTSEGHEVNAHAHEVARAVESVEPGLVVSRMTKALRTDKVLIDWSQNNPAKTTVTPYSMRALSEPSVSTPVTWDEVEACAASGDSGALRFSPAAVLERVDRSVDLMAIVLA
jgi:bifunctional non-homologous end joining protein LigD